MVARSSAPCFQVRPISNPPGALRPGDLTVRPRRGQRRQQANLSLVALQQHLGDGRRAAEVAVDLKRRVRVEHVGIGALGAEQELQNVVRVIAVGRACAQRLMRHAVAQPVA